MSNQLLLLFCFLFLSLFLSWTHTFAFATDIEKAFLHVKLHESDRDSTRFLWVSDVSNPSGTLTTYRFKVVPFGTSSSPFMLNAMLDLHLKKFPLSVARDMESKS